MAVKPQGLSQLGPSCHDLSETEAPIKKIAIFSWKLSL